MKNATNKAPTVSTDTDNDFADETPTATYTAWTSDEHAWCALGGERARERSAEWLAEGTAAARALVKAGY